jgi:signal peptidase I
MLRDEQGNVSSELACGLAEEVVRTFGELRLRVLGTSMAPAILPGDLLSVRRARLTDLSAGEVVLFSRRGRFFAHRIVGRTVPAEAANQNETCLITRGDRLRDDDPPVLSTELLGRVVEIQRGNLKIDLPLQESHPSIARLLRSSDRATYLYVRLAAWWRTLFQRGAKCQV